MRMDTLIELWMDSGFIFAQFDDSGGFGHLLSSQVHEVVRKASGTDEIEMVDGRVLDDGQYRMIFALAVRGKISGPYLSPRESNQRRVAGFGYYNLSSNLNKLSDEELRPLLIAQQRLPLAGGARVVRLIACGGCATCRFYLDPGCLLGHEEYGCAEWLPSQSTSEPAGANDDSADS